MQQQAAAAFSELFPPVVENPVVARLPNMLAPRKAACASPSQIKSKGQRATNRLRDKAPFAPEIAPQRAPNNGPMSSTLGSALSSATPLLQKSPSSISDVASSEANGKDFDEGVFFELPLTADNKAACDELTRLTETTVRKMLSTSKNNTIAVLTEDKGGSSKIYWAVDDDEKYIIIKEMRGYKEAQKAGTANLNFSVYSTKPSAARKEERLTKRFSPELNSKIVVKDPDNNTCLVMDFMPATGSMALRRSANQKEAARYLLYTAALRAANMHDQGFAHNDLKLENILVRQDATVVLCDFGLSTDEFLANDRRGTFLSPELVKQDCRQTMATDTYSLGVSILEHFVKSGAKSQENSEVETITEITPFWICHPEKQWRANHDTIESFRNLELYGTPTQNPGAHKLIKRYSDYKKRDPEVYFFIIERFLETNPKKRVTMTGITEGLENLGHNAQSRDAARKDMSRVVFSERRQKYYEKITKLLTQVKQAERVG